MNSLQEHFKQLWTVIFNIASGFTFKDLVDIIVMGLVIYGCIKLIRDTRAGQLIKGLLLLGGLYILSMHFEMVMLSAILDQIVRSTAVVLIILFQPEIRKALEQMGRNNMGRTFKGLFTEKGRTFEEAKIAEVIENVVETAAMLQQMRMGALIVFERRTKLNEIAETGTMINADATAQLMGNIFYNKAPLHDGALIIRDGRILAAGCILPLTGRTNVHANLGTRHRAGLGISEDSDAVAVIVSEETGQISIAQNGVLTRNFTRLTLKETLEDVLLTSGDAKENGRKNIIRKLRLKTRKGGVEQDES